MPTSPYGDIAVAVAVAVAKAVAMAVAVAVAASYPTSPWGKMAIASVIVKRHLPRRHVQRSGARLVRRGGGGASGEQGGGSGCKPTEGCRVEGGLARVVGGVGVCARC